MKERKIKAKLISGDGLTKYIDYPELARTIRTVIIWPIEPWIPESIDCLALTTSVTREYELCDVREYKDYTVGIYRERRSAT